MRERGEIRAQEVIRESDRELISHIKRDLERERESERERARESERERAREGERKGESEGERGEALPCCKCKCLARDKSNACVCSAGHS